MKIFRQSYLLFLGILLGCDSGNISGQYHNIGVYGTNLNAQNGAIRHITAKYSSLPDNRYYKVKYSVTNALPTEGRENAIWYDKGKTELVFEADVASGPICTWREVSKTVLDQASKSASSLSKVDSLAKPNQSFGQCR